jgi:hypothetical protein
MIKKILKNSLLLLMINSCALEQKFDNSLPKIEKDFEPYVEEFIYLSNGKVKPEDFGSVSIKFGSFDENNRIIGRCSTNGIYKRITIDRKYWEQNSVYMIRAALIQHELAHCILDRRHTSPNSEITGLISFFENLMFKLGFRKNKGYLDDLCPSSLMHPSAPSLYCLKKHWRYYEIELFNEDYPKPSSSILIPYKANSCYKTL